MAHITCSDDGLRELALFAGAGGGILGGMLLGWRTVCAVEIEPYPASVLMQRQNDGILPPFPIWDDVCTFDGKPWRGIVDVVSGGFPCQDISAAGKGAGITGERSGLWKELARIIGEVRPRYAFVENSPVLTSRGLDVVLGDLAEMGYNARYGVVSAADAGAPHLRERIWILAYASENGRGDKRIARNMVGAKRPESERGDKLTLPIDSICPDVADTSKDNAGQSFEQPNDKRTGPNYPSIGEGLRNQPSGCGEVLADAMHQRLERGERGGRANQAGREEPDGPATECGTMADPFFQQWDGRLYWPGWWEREPLETLCDAWRRGGEENGESELKPLLGRVANGVAARVDRLKAIGNGQCPQAMALAWNILSEGLI